MPLLGHAPIPLGLLFGLDCRTGCFIGRLQYSRCLEDVPVPHRDVIAIL